MEFDYTAYVVRVLHMVGAALFVGGVLYAAVGAAPLAKRVDKDARPDFMLAAQKRSYRLLHPAMLLLLVTGLMQYATGMESYSEIGSRMHMVIGTKMLIALVAFFILVAQTARLIKKGQVRWWLAMGVLGLVVIVLASYARAVRLGFLENAAAGAAAGGG